MARRSARTPLYDLIRTERRRESPPADQTEAESPPSALEEAEGWLSPGRAIRLPVGYLLLAIAVVIGVAIGAFIIGHHQGTDAARAEYDDALFGANGAGASRPIDPLAQTEAAGAGVLGADTEPAPFRFESPTPREANQDQTAPGAEHWGPLRSDPRQAGYNYYVLVQTTAEGADRVARYCRKNGLEAYVLPVKNTPHWRVIALPGFKPADSLSAEVRRLREQIRRIGGQWKRAEGGVTDFGDAYPSLYSG